ncbi:aldose epimerase family protein [Zobellia nedashkovskayae]
MNDVWVLAGPNTSFRQLLLGKSRLLFDRLWLPRFCNYTFLGSDTAPVGHGWHPYFMAPEKADVYSLEIEQQGYYVIDHDLIPTGELVDTFGASDLKPIGGTELNHCFVLEKGNVIKVKLINSINGREVEISTKGYPYMQVYIPPNRNCIALEPCTCIPDAFNNQVGSRYLKPSEVWELQFDITIKA